MTQLDKLIAEKLSRLDSVPDAFADKIDAHQKDVFEELLKLIDGLERKGGYLVLSEANIAEVGAVISKLKVTFFNSNYTSLLRSFADEFDAQSDITDEFFELGFERLPDDEAFDIIRLATKRQGIEMFSESVIDQLYFRPLKENLMLSVTNQVKFTEVIESVRRLSIGNAQAEGLLQAHAKTYARTSFSIADRNYTTTIAQNYKVDWYKYSGNTVSDTREFCDTRHNKFYTSKEVEKWGSMKWSGMIKGTNSSTIFTNLGGWNCRHSLIPVSVFGVPKDVVRKAIKRGDYKANKAVMEWLEAA